jgi:hypothetical protein
LFIYFILAADIDFIFEIGAYFLGIFFNALLPLGVNTAYEKVCSLFSHNLTAKQNVFRY